MKKFSGGIYPTMITPYKGGKIDFEAAGRLVDWYIEMGCTGIFAVCQSSEMVYLSLSERVSLAEAVVKRAAGKINVVASGHIGNSTDEQIEEINAIAETGIDAFVLVSNRFDRFNDGDDVWLANAEKVLAGINADIPLGIYECPIPYKRLLTPRILKWCKSTGRFKFIKDTCCSTEMLKDRLELLKDSGIMLFNANEQTLLYSLKLGGAGYSGIMANFHPDLLAWLYNNYESEKAEKLSNALSMLAFTEGPTYPCTAKYYLNNFEGIPMEVFARSSNEKQLTGYQKLILKQMYDLHNDLRNML